MYNYEYVDKNEYSPTREELNRIINLVQDEVRDKFTFQYKFIGSSSRNMITCDYSQNIGYDYDVDITVNDANQQYSASDIKNILMNAFNKINQANEYGYCEDSTRVFTIKVVRTHHSKILHSCDFAIVHDCSNGKRQYIHYNKRQNTYEWQYKEKGYYEVPKKIKWLKKKTLWTEVRNQYIVAKNENTDPNKHSSAIFAQTVNQVAKKYIY